MNNFELNRRDFLVNVIGAAAMIPLVGCGNLAISQQPESDILRRIKLNALPDGGEWSGAIRAPANVSARCILAPKDKGGNTIEISGTVYESNGKTVAPNTLIYFYHTDINGHYGSKARDHGHYQGWMLTDSEGRYSFRTIRPAQYPSRRQSAHIHMTVTGLKQREEWIDSILFDGDPLISTRERDESGKRGGFEPIVKLDLRDGIYYAERNIALLNS